MCPTVVCVEGGFSQIWSHLCIDREDFGESKIDLPMFSTANIMHYMASLKKEKIMELMTS